MDTKKALLLILFLITTSCSFDETKEKNFSKKDLIGNWNCDFKDNTFSIGKLDSELIIKDDFNYIMKNNVSLYNEGGINVKYINYGKISLDGNILHFELKKQDFLLKEEPYEYKKKLIKTLTSEVPSTMVSFIKILTNETFIFAKNKSIEHPYFSCKSDK